MANILDMNDLCDLDLWKRKKTLKLFIQQNT